VLDNAGWHHASELLWPTYDLLRKTDAAWLTLTPERIKTLCHYPWIVHANQSWGIKAL
jgi:hypothetical protein